MQNHIKRCYLCGSTENLTRDHVPPKGLFLSPRPSNLKTVPCCYTCNNSASKDDEYFRLAVSSMINRSPEGERVWNQKVIGSTFQKKRIRNLTDEVLMDSGSGVSLIDGELKPITWVAVRADEIRRVLTKLAKGFLYLTHPEIDATTVEFKPEMLEQFRVMEMVEMVQKAGFPHFSLGDGVFDMWRGFEKTDLRNGLWLFLFYGSAGFVVHQSPKSV